MPNVSDIIKSIQDIMRKEAGTYGDEQRLEQLGWSRNIGETIAMNAGISRRSTRN